MTSGSPGLISHHFRGKVQEYVFKYKLISHAEGHFTAVVLCSHSYTDFKDLGLYGPWALLNTPTALCSLFSCVKVTLPYARWV